MLFGSVKDQCTLKVLRILNRNLASYSDLFKKTKVSHITLQTVLKKLKEKQFIKDVKQGSFNKKGYDITDKGLRFLRQLEKLKEIIE